MTSSPNWSAGQDNWLIFLEGTMTNCCWGSAQTGRLSAGKGMDQNSGVCTSDRYPEITGGVSFGGVTIHRVYRSLTSTPAQGHRPNSQPNPTSCTITFLPMVQIMSKLPSNLVINVILQLYVEHIWLKFKAPTGRLPPVPVDVMQAKSFLCNPADKRNQNTSSPWQSE